MGNTSGALGFVEGLMGGMQRREEHDRNKKLDRLLDQKATDSLNADVGKYETHLNEGGDPMNWVFQQEQEDPFLMKQFKKFGNWLSGTEPADRTDPYAAAREQYANRDVEEGSQSPVADAPSGKLVDYADGGTVGEEEERRRRQRGRGYSDTRGGQRALPHERDETGTAGRKIAAGAGAAYVASPHLRRGVYRGVQATGRGVGALGRAGAGGAALLRRGANSALGRVAAPVTAAINIAEQTDPNYDEKLERRFGDFDAPGLRVLHDENPGDASFGGFAKYLGRRILGYASDLGDTLMFGQLDEASGAARNAIAGVESEQPEQAVPTTPPAQRSAIDEAMGPPAPDAEMAANAQQAGAEATPGHPQHPDQQFDFAAMAQDGWDSADIAHVPLKDWEEYRRNHVLASIKQGVNVSEANAQVDEIQYGGFMRNFRQASYLMMAGDEAGAALAARAAYQYFPNGTDIRFQPMVGKDGQDYLVAAGFDEKTGEMRGEPQVMTPDYVNAMLANFEDPKAFNAWKADKEEAYRLERQYQEVDKPTAQADLDLKGAQTDYYRSGAQKNRADAAGGGRPALKPSDKVAAHDRFTDAVGLLALEDPQLSRQLVAVMERIYADNGGQVEIGVIDSEVQKLYEQGGIEALNALVAEWTDG